MDEIHRILSAADIPSLLEMEADFVASYPQYSLSFKRYFLSSAEQKGQIPQTAGNVSFVVQPVLGTARVAVWLFLTRDYPVELIWTTNLCSKAQGSECQTKDILSAYGSQLASKGLTIPDNCVRTWFYVQDIDHNYNGVVTGRREDFETRGMTPATHYLASTGIEGGAVEEGTSVQMDALAIKGAFSQHYLYAPENFNPTHEYGVTFERGTVVDYGEKSHVLISGTASINNKGEIVYPGDVRAQTLHMFSNVEALLSEAGSRWEDVRMAAVYLRNASDYEAVEPIVRDRLSSTGIPYVITLAPVCRPGWLIEMECISLITNIPTEH